MTVHIRIIISMLFLAVAGCGNKGGAPAPAAEAKKPKLAASPEEAVALMFAAAQAGDMEAYVQQMGEGPRNYHQAQLDAEAALTGWEEAADEKFGKQDAAKRFHRSADNIKRVIAMTVTSKQEDKPTIAFLTVKIKFSKKDGSVGEFDDHYYAIKDGDAWKLLPQIPFTGTLSSDPKDKEWASACAPVAASKLAIESETKSVKEGKYKTREEAEAALRGAAGLGLSL